MTSTEHHTWWAENTAVPYGLCWCGCGEPTPIATYTNRAKGYARGRPTAFARGHATRLKRKLEAEQLPEPNPSGLCMCGCGEPTPLARQTSRSQDWVRGKPIRYLPNHAPRPLSAEQEAEACHRYKAGENCRKIGESLNVSRKAVAAALERNGIARDAGTRFWTEEMRESRRTHCCNHSFFDSIDSEEKAYWLGFLAADGCNTSGFMAVALSSKDRDHLVRFKSHLQSTHPIGDYQHTRSGASGERIRLTSRLAIRSPQLTAGLATHGVVPRKTFVLKWPDFLSRDLLRHYLRGYSDGDGCFHVRRAQYVRKTDGRSSHGVSWMIVGNEAFLKGAQRYLVETIGFDQTKLYPSPNARNEGIFQLRYGGNKQIARLWHLLYDGAAIYLPRKRAVAEPYIS